MLVKKLIAHVARLATILLVLFATPSMAQDTFRSCAGVAVRSIDVQAESGRELLLDATPEQIDIVFLQLFRPAASVTEKIVTALARGPVLGAMDSPKVRTELICTATGFMLTAILTRSADYNGAVLANVNWRPKIAIVLALRQPEAEIQVVWKMVLTTGAELNRARTPPYSEQKYPAIANKTIP